MVKDLGHATIQPKTAKQQSLLLPSSGRVMGIYCIDPPEEKAASKQNISEVLNNHLNNIQTATNYKKVLCRP